MSPDFYYECAKCKAKIPAWFGPQAYTEVKKVKVEGPVKVEVTFRCQGCPDHD
jgi:hypothetical protein